MNPRILAALCTLGIGACTDDALDDDGLGGPPPSFDDSKADGTTAARPAWNWANETPAEFEAEQVAHLDWTDPMSVRLQFWADTADAALRKKYGSLFANIPKPQIFVDTDSLDNFVSGTNALTRQATVCLPEAVKLAKPGGTAMKIVGWSNNGTVGEQTSCLARPADASAHAAIITAFNASSGECKITNGTSSFTYGANCLYSVELSGGPKSGTSAAYQATSSYIAFEPGLLALFADEDEMLYALFHELGHYYRAHMTTPTDAYNYFYALDTWPAGKMPVPDSTYASLTKSVHAAMQENAVNKTQYSFTADDNEVESKHLGFYTIEQEADDFSLEVLSLVNVDPNAAVRALLDLGTDFEASDGTSPGELTADQCRALVAAQWKDASGKPVHVPVGTIADIHHSPCFRTWNVAREIAAHGYTADPTKRPTPPGGDWKALVAALPM